MLVCINKGASENDDDVENEDEIKVTRVCRFTASIIFYFNTAKSTHIIYKNIKHYHTLVCATYVFMGFTSYGEVWVTEAKNKDTGKEMLKLITCITEDKQGLLWGKSRPKKKKTGRCLRGFGLQLYVYRSLKRRGYMNLEKMYVRTWIWRTEINYLENKNGHGWVQVLK